MIFATGNRNKAKEFEDILGLKIEQKELDLEEIQAVEAEKVVEHKTREAFKKTGEFVITEDTALYFDAWNGLPGALAKFFGERIGWQGLAGLLGDNRKASAETVIGFFDGKKYTGFSGRIEGSIARRASGDGGFGWDAIFVPDGFERTFAEMEDKNSFSMRRKALDKFKKFLENE